LPCKTCQLKYSKKISINIVTPSHTLLPESPASPTPLCWDPSYFITWISSHPSPSETPPTLLPEFPAPSPPQLLRPLLLYYLSLQLPPPHYWDHSYFTTWVSSHPSVSPIISSYFIFSKRFEYLWRRRPFNQTDTSEIYKIQFSKTEKTTLK